MTTVFIGNLDDRTNERDLEREFGRYGRIRDIWIARRPPGFAFVEFGHPRDAQDAVRGSDGRYIWDKRVRVEISDRKHGTPNNDRDRDRDRNGRFDRPRQERREPRRTEFRVRFTDLSASTSWQKLKDALRGIGHVPVYCNVITPGTAVTDFQSADDADRVIEKLNNTTLDGATIRAAVDNEPLPVSSYNADDRGSSGFRGGDRDDRGSSGFRGDDRGSRNDDRGRNRDNHEDSEPQETAHEERRRGCSRSRSGSVGRGDN